jgi:Xaa-Pro aminopeptidase
MMISVPERIEALRHIMKNAGIDAFYITGYDPHLGEYLPARWKVREFITGFTGSYGMVVVSSDHAGLWTDTRYFLQAENELQGSGIEIHRLRVPDAVSPEDWMVSCLPSGSRIGIDLSTIPIASFRELELKSQKAGIGLVPVPDPFDEIWEDRPELPTEPVFELDLRYTGLSRSEKAAAICSELVKRNAALHLICATDELAWVFNLRGNDIPYNPVFTSYGVIGPDQRVLFIDREKIPADLQRKLKREGISIQNYNQVIPFLESLSGLKVYADPLTTNCSVLKGIEKNCTLVEGVSIAAILKSRKNSTEVEGFRSAMRKDGVALIKFLHWLKNNIGVERITEYTVGRKLAAFRSENEGFAGESFPPIVGYRDHGALVHFTVNETNAYEIETEGVLLFDSGGHYFDGTTDVTRTIALGGVTEQMKTDFTLALKGVITLTQAKFPYGTKGCHLDILARKSLWDNGLNYGHGTGHGVGHFLNVHEGPMSIRQEYNVNNIEPGMILSNEPALYRENQYGIRTENMMVCIENGENNYGRFLGFDTLTLCPIDKNLIKADLLTCSEREWIDLYHLKVREELKPLIPVGFKDFLEDLTSELDHQKGTVK